MSRCLQLVLTLTLLNLTVCGCGSDRSPLESSPAISTESGAGLAPRPAHPRITVAAAPTTSPGIQATAEPSSRAIPAVRLVTADNPAAAQDATAPVPLHPGIHQLFLDAALIADRTNITSTLHAPRKFPGNPVVMPAANLEVDALLYGTVLFDDDAKCFKMWYFTGRAGTQMSWTLAYATSQDGIHWKKPDLDVISGLPSPNNIVMTHPLTENFGEPFSVIIDRHDPDPARRYKMVYRYLTPLPEMKALGTTTAVSADGIHWKPFGRVQMPEILDIGHFIYDPLQGKFAVYGRLWADRRQVQLAYSDDFASWTKPTLVADINEQDPAGTQLYSLAVHVDGGQYIGLAQLYMRGTTHLLEFELAASRDGRTWTRVHQGETFLPCGGHGEWDRFNNSISSNPVRVGNELWFYYGGRTYRHSGYGGKDRGTEEAQSLRARVGGTAKETDKQAAFTGMRSAIGLAKLRLDGYVSLSASYDGGTVTTVPVIPGASSLHINAAARWGRITVEVLDQQGQPIPGARSLPVEADGTDLTVRWPAPTGSPLAAKRPIQLRFTLHNARLYSYWVQ